MIEAGRRGGGLRDKAFRLVLATLFGGLVLGVILLPLAEGAVTGSCSTVVERCAADPSCSDCTSTITRRRRERSRRGLQEGDDDDGDDDGGASSAGAGGGGSELCSTRYPSLVSGGAVSFCGRVGAAKCCEFSDNDAASTCMDDPLSAEAWDCYLSEEIGCGISDMPCHASFSGGATTSPTPSGPLFMTSSPTATPTSAPTLAPTVAAPVVTAAPTLGIAASTPTPTAGSRGGIVVPTASPAPALGLGEEDAVSGANGMFQGRFFYRDRAVLFAAAAAAVALLSGVLGTPLGL